MQLSFSCEVNRWKLDRKYPFFINENHVVLAYILMDLASNARSNRSRIWKIFMYYFNCTIGAGKYLNWNLIGVYQSSLPCPFGLNIANCGCDYLEATKHMASLSLNPDLNPIKHFWNELGREIRRSPSRASG